MLLVKMDKEGFYVKDVILQTGEDLPDDVVKVLPAQGLYKPRWTGTEWVEGATQEYIDSITNVVVEPSEQDELLNYVLDLDMRMVMIEMGLI